MTDTPTKLALTTNDIARFWPKVRIPANENDCWIWTGIVSDRGYGRFSVGGLLQQAHRAAWAIKTGHWPTQQVLHRCDTPLCVNHRHLFHGTQSDNVQDAIRKGRHPCGSQRSDSKLNEIAVGVIRFLFGKGVTGAALASAHNVSPQLISQVVLRQRWRQTP